MKLKDIIDRSILKERGKIYSYITNFYSEINKDDIRPLSAIPEKEIIGNAFEIKELRELYYKHIKDCLKNDLFCDIAADILIQDGKCIIDKYKFGNLLKDVECSSPSMAAALVVGQSANGWTGISSGNQPAGSRRYPDADNPRSSSEHKERAARVPQR